MHLRKKYMNARHLNKRIYGLVACGILAHAFLVAAPDDDAFSVAIPADLIRAHRIFSEEGVTFTEWRNGAPPLAQEAIERIKKRLGESVATANENFASSLLRQPYRIAADRSSYYERVRQSMGSGRVLLARQCPAWDKLTAGSVLKGGEPSLQAELHFRHRAVVGSHVRLLPFDRFAEVGNDCGGTGTLAIGA